MVQHIVLWIIEVICLMFTLLSTPLYIIFLITLHKYRKHGELKGPFFRIMFSLGVNDLVTTFLFYFFYHSLYLNFLMPMHNFGGDIMLRMWLMVSLGLQRSQYLTVLVAALNRFTALVFPWSFDHVWGNRVTKTAIILPYFLGILSLGYLPIICDVRLGKPASRNITWMVWYDKTCYTATFGGTGMLMFLLACLFIVLYAVMFAKTWKKSNNVEPKTNATKQREKREKASRNLAIVGFVLSFLIIVQAVLFATIGIFQEHYYKNQDFYQILTTINSVIFSMVNPYLMLLLCKKVREKFLFTFKSPPARPQVGMASGCQRRIRASRARGNQESVF